MAYKSLRDFMAMLEAEGELVRVSEPVSTHLEMTEIQTRRCAFGCHAFRWLWRRLVDPFGRRGALSCHRDNHR